MVQLLFSLMVCVPAADEGRRVIPHGYLIPPPMVSSPTVAIHDDGMETCVGFAEITRGRMIRNARAAQVARNFDPDVCPGYAKPFEPRPERTKPLDRLEFLAAFDLTASRGWICGTYDHSMEYFDEDREVLHLILNLCFHTDRPGNPFPVVFTGEWRRARLNLREAGL